MSWKGILGSRARPQKGMVKDLILIQFQGKVTSLVKPELALLFSASLGAGLGAGHVAENWQRNRVATLLGLFLHQETRFPVTHTHESAFPLSIIHSKKCNSTGLGGMEEKKEYSMTLLSSALLSSPDTLLISSQMTLRFHKISFSENLTEFRGD